MSNNQKILHFLIQYRLIDDKEQLTNIFWADTRSIIDYKYFGDATSFDTSLSISTFNKYEMIFAPFIGINHHVFGATLLFDKTIPLFLWLFNTFKNVMSRQQLKAIFTDQSSTMKAAIEIVFLIHVIVFACGIFCKCCKKSFPHL